MSEAFESIMRGLDEARRHVRGEDTGAVVHQIEVKRPDVKAIRASTGLTQDAFALTIGVATGTLRGWEQNRRVPYGPTRVLLAMIEKDPQIVQRTLGKG